MSSYHNFDDKRFVSIQAFKSIEVERRREHHNVGIEDPFSLDEVFDGSYSAYDAVCLLTNTEAGVFVNKDFLIGRLFTHNYNEMRKGYEKLSWDHILKQSEPEPQWKPLNSSEPVLSHESGSVAKIERLENRVRQLELQSAYNQGKIEAYESLLVTAYNQDKLETDESLLAPVALIIAAVIRRRKLLKHFKTLIRKVKKLK